MKSMDYLKGYQDATGLIRDALLAAGIPDKLIGEVLTPLELNDTDCLDDAGTGSLIIEWRVEDIAQLRPDLTTIQARSVLAHVASELDATIGVTWDTIECAANELFPLEIEPAAHRSRFPNQ